MNILDLKKISSNFQKELELAINGHKTSLPFIINPIPIKNIVINNEIFQVIVIGGSIFKSALVQEDENKLKILKVTENNIPILKTKNIFLKFILENIEKNINFLALNFAYGIKPVFRDGILDGANPIPSKKVPLEGFENENIGELIEKYIYKNTGKVIKVSVANDTICLLLSSLTQEIWDNTAAGIAGTGLNFSFFIDKNKAVNLESGSFDKFPQTKTGKIIDSSHEKGEDLFEKETAGAYLYQHFNFIIKENNISYSKLIKTSQLSKLAIKKDLFVSKIAKDLLIRSAKLLSCQIAGITKFKKQDMIFIMEGSLFWKGYNYKETVEQTIKKLVPEYKVTFIQIENSDILGAAKLLC